MFQPELEVASPGVETPFGLGIWYDSERIALEGAYSDQVTAYRARRRWIRALEANFLLEGKHDFSVRVVRDETPESFRVICAFLTACGRYAFWRLTHNQAPEVQYLIETAHLPSLTIIPQQTILLEDDFADMDPAILTGSFDGPPTLWRSVQQMGRWIRSRLAGR